MADALSLGSGMVGFVQLADRVISACKYFIETVKDAPKDMQIILGEVTSLRAIIESLNGPNLHTNGIVSNSSLFEEVGPLEGCRRCLSALENLLPAERPGSSLPKSRAITLTELAWPLKASKARKLLAEISQHKATLLLAITGEMIHDIKDVKAGVGLLGDAMTEFQRQQVFKWLESSNPSLLHNAAFKKHEKNTGAWLLRSVEWENWQFSADSNRLLWIHGIPGAGKTVLASFIIEELKELCEGTEMLGCAYYYCHYSHGQDEAVSLLRWTVCQLCRQAKWIPQKLKELHDQGCDPKTPELENALAVILTRFKHFYLVVDALDESSPREDLLAVIKTMAVDERFHNLKILATSRQYYDIERSLAGISPLQKFESN